jgi:hypothetical protein
VASPCEGRTRARTSMRKGTVTPAGSSSSLRLHPSLGVFPSRLKGAETYREAHAGLGSQGKGEIDGPDQVVQSRSRAQGGLTTKRRQGEEFLRPDRRLSLGCGRPRMPAKRPRIRLRRWSRADRRRTEIDLVGHPPPRCRPGHPGDSGVVPRRRDKKTNVHRRVVGRGLGEVSRSGLCPACSQ